MDKEVQWEIQLRVIKATLTWLYIEEQWDPGSGASLDDWAEEINEEIDVDFPRE